ncbi:MAG: GAF domain-containing protein, partial [Ignavibacteriales bacterium]|nr:GAF domain-containing protein [Ignavibacteriales bacterium]
MPNSIKKPENLAAIEQSVDELIANSKPLEAVEIVLQYAAELGVHFPAKPDTADITNAYADIIEALKGRAIEDLLQAPVMKDPEKSALVQLLAKIAVPVSTLRPEIFALSTLKQVLFSIQYGNNPVSCHAYVLFAAMLSGQFNDINSAYRFGKVGLELVEHLESIQYKTTLLQIFNLFIKHWVEPVKNTLPSLELGYRHGLKNGEIAEATLCAHIFTAYSYFSAIGLPEIERALEEYESANKKHNQYLTSGYNRTFRQAIQILMRSKLRDVISLNGEIYNAGEMLKLFEAEKSSTGLFLHHFNGMILKFLFRENSAALEDSKKAGKYLHFVAGMFHYPVYVFYDALILLGNYESYSKNKKATVNSQVLEHLESLHGWVDFNAGNHQHKFDLVSAEYARVIGNDGTAREYYDKAINGAHENGFFQEEALANELAAEFYLQRGKMQFARYHILEAKNNYQAWGALAKVQDLENRYTELFNSLQNTTGSMPAYGESFQSLKDRTLQITNSFIDLSSLIKASHSITGEFDISNLLRKLMDILVESTGAQRGFLILENENGLFIEAEAESGNKTINVLKSLALEQASGEVSIAIVNYVMRTKETVVLGGTFDTRAFSHDPYIRKNLPKSLLCVPVLMQGRIFGVLYLENNLVPDGFPEERVELLKILATQAAMVIENARLYADLEERVRTRTEELAITNSQLRGEIEEHKRTQEALFGKEKDYRIIFNSVPAMIWYVDCDGKILRGNQSAYDSLQISETEIVGKRLHDVFQRPEAEKFSADIKEVFKTGQSKLGIIETFTTPDGNKKWSKTEKVP